MSKSFVVIDTPKTCADCPFHYYSYSEDMNLICLVFGNNYGPVLENEMEKRPKDCPLRIIANKLVNELERLQKMDEKLEELFKNQIIISPGRTIGKSHLFKTLNELKELRKQKRAD